MGRWFWVCLHELGKRYSDDYKHFARVLAVFTHLKKSHNTNTLKKSYNAFTLK